MKSRLLAGVVAVLLAIVGAVIVVSYAQGADQRAVSSLDPVGVLVVTKAVPAGSPVEALKASVALEELPGAAVAETALNTLDGAAGKVTAADLVPGEQLLAERLVSPEELKTLGSVPVPAGLQEVSFQLEPQRVVGGRLAAGDTVGIFITMPNGGIEDKPDQETVQLSIRKALVTAVQRAPEAAAAAPAPSASERSAGSKVDFGARQLVARNRHRIRVTSTFPRDCSWSPLPSTTSTPTRSSSPPNLRRSG